MFHICVIEDNAEDLRVFEQEFLSFIQQEGLECHLDAFQNGKSFLSSFANQYDVIFSDIELEEENGIEVCKKVRELDERVIIVFLTNMAQYAIRGYEVNALDYLLKPLSAKIYEVKMRRVFRIAKTIARLERPISINGGKTLLKPSEIIYVEVDKHDVLFHTASEIFRVRSSLKEEMAKLEESSFVRANYCYLVNLRFIRGIDKNDLLLSNGQTLQISRSRRKEILERFALFSGGSV